MDRGVKEFESVYKTLTFLSYSGQDILSEITMFSVDELGITLSEMNNILCSIKMNRLEDLCLHDIEALITCLKKIPYRVLKRCSGSVAYLEEEFTKLKNSMYNSETI